MDIMLHDPAPRLRLYPILAAIPDAQILWVGPQVCSRHGMMTFLHDLRGRLSFFCYSEIDAVTGDYIRKIRDAALEIITERNASALIIATVCQGAVLGTDAESLKKSITEASGVPVEYIVTNRLFMHSRQKHELMNRKPEPVLFQFLKSVPPSPEMSVNLLGHVDGTEEGELHSFLRSAGVQSIRTLRECRNREEYQAMAGAHLNIVLDPSMETAAVEMESSLHIPWLSLSVYNPSELIEQYKKLHDRIGGDFSTIEDWDNRVNEKLREVRTLLNGHCLVIDHMRVRSGAALSRWLQESGVDVREIAGFGPPGMRPGGRRKDPGTGIGRPDGGPDRNSLEHGRRGMGKHDGRGMQRPHRRRPEAQTAGRLMPPGFAEGERKPQPAGYAACIQILDKIIKTAEDTL